MAKHKNYKILYAIYDQNHYLPLPTSTLQFLPLSMETIHISSWSCFNSMSPAHSATICMDVHTAAVFRNSVECLRHHMACLPKWANGRWILIAEMNENSIVSQLHIYSNSHVMLKWGHHHHTISEDITEYSRYRPFSSFRLLQRVSDWKDIERTKNTQRHEWNSVS